MGKLTAALDWAQRGFSVFPLQENSKEPVSDDWPSVASNDLEIVRQLWTDPVLGMEKDYNIGVLCTDIVVIDIDVKEGKDGYNEYAQLAGHYDTLVVQTPTGGFHCYFNGPDSSNSSISKSVDVRSHNGYVVAPGSVIDGKQYVVVKDQDMAWVPATIESMLRPPYTRSEQISDVTLDTEAAIQAGIRFLDTAPPAIQGRRGDETTFITAARLVREMALSVPTAWALMRDYWNPKCQPPWDVHELLAKVENAAAYGTADLGKLSAEALYGDLDMNKILEPPSIFAQLDNPWGNAVLPDRIPPRPWLMERALLEGAVTLLLAAGSAGKSSVSLAMAAHLALGLPFAGFKARRACKTIIYNGEDDIHEQSRRLTAVCVAYGFDYAEVKKNIMLLSPRQIKLNLVDFDFRKPVRNDALVKHLIEECSDPDVGLLILDPLVKIHKCEESDNVQMDFVMETLTDIAVAARISVLALHHTTKASTQAADRVGNMDVGRGASAIVNAARIAFTMFNATAQDCEDYGLNDAERHTWVRFDDAKMNLALANDNAVWFRKHAVKLYNGDAVGVLQYEELQKSMHHIRLRIGRLLVGTMLGMGAGSMLINQAVATIKANEPLWANKTDTDIRRKIEGFFASPVAIEGRTLHIRRDVNDKQQEKVIVTLT